MQTAGELFADITCRSGEAHIYATPTRNLCIILSVWNFVRQGCFLSHLRRQKMCKTKLSQWF